MEGMSSVLKCPFISHSDGDVLSLCRLTDNWKHKIVGLKVRGFSERSRDKPETLATSVHPVYPVSSCNFRQEGIRK